MASKSIALSFLETAELRSGGIITEREINALKNRWSGFRRKPYLLRENSMESGAEVEQAHVEHYGPYRISDEQFAKGIKWWRSMLFTSKGSIRNTMFLRELGIASHELSVDQLNGSNIVCAVREPSYFELVGFEETSNPTYSMTWVHPRYMLVGKDGRGFSYVARPWQSGQGVLDTIEMQF